MTEGGGLSITELDQVRTLQEWGKGLTEISGITGIPVRTLDLALWAAVDHAPMSESFACRMMATATRYDPVFQKRS